MALWTTPLNIMGTGSGKARFTSGKTVGANGDWFSWRGLGIIGAALGVGLLLGVSMAQPAPRRQQRRRQQQRRRPQQRRQQPRRRQQRRRPRALPR